MDVGRKYSEQISQFLGSSESYSLTSGHRSQKEHNFCTFFDLGYTLKIGF